MLSRACRHSAGRIAFHPYQSTPIRQYAQRSKGARPDIATARAIEAEYSANAGLNAVEQRANGDPITPPRSTLPPPLNLPERDKSQGTFVYLLRLGRAYGTFYKEGIKAVWFNYKASRLLEERITKELGAKDRFDAAARGLITRSDWQILKRNGHDISKLPLFGVLVVVFGEWLPLLVPWIPGAVPSTCYIPSQIRGMRTELEERRRISFRMGNVEPTDYPALMGESAGKEQPWTMTSAEHARSVVSRLRDDQLHHISSSLGLHSRLWDRVQLHPFRSLMRRRITNHLRYLAIDDRLLVHAGQPHRLPPSELERACEERGLDVLGRPEATLRDHLTWWLQRQEQDKGRGRAMLSMLFRRLAIREWVQLHLDANDRSQA